MGNLDNPIDAAQSQFAEFDENLLGETALDLGGLIYLPLAAFNIFRNRLSNKERLKRVEALFRVFANELKYLGEQIASDREQIKTINERLNTPDFSDALFEAGEAAQRTTNDLKVKRLAAVLTNGLRGVGLASGEELGGFIRDLSELDEADVQMLYVMSEIYKDAINSRPNMDNPDEFTFYIAGFFRKTDELNIQRDDVYARLSRLSGFGLAIEVMRNPSRMAPGEYCFRPTLRGLRLVRLLQQAQ